MLNLFKINLFLRHKGAHLERWIHKQLVLIKCTDFVVKVLLQSFVHFQKLKSNFQLNQQFLKMPKHAQRHP